MADKVKPKVTYLWLTRDCTGLVYSLTTQRPVKVEHGWNLTKGYHLSYVSSRWEAITGIKLEIEGICRVKRTGLPNGLKWEVCDD